MAKDSPTLVLDKTTIDKAIADHLAESAARKLFSKEVLRSIAAKKRLPKNY